MARIGDKYIFGESIGVGNFGSVFVAEEKETREKLAIKVITKVQPGEVEIYDSLRNLRHDNIVQIETIGFNDCQFCIVMEYCDGGNLYNLIKERIPRKAYFEDAEMAEIIRQVVSGLKYLHSKNIIHRDLKPANIVRRKRNGIYILKITDFGLSHSVNQKTLINDERRFEIFGTRIYMAPEVLDFSKQITSKVDMWALGIVLYQLLTLDLSLNYECEIKAGDFSFLPNETQLSSTLKLLLAMDLERRPTAEDLANGIPLENQPDSMKLIPGYVVGVTKRTKPNEAHPEISPNEASNEQNHVSTENDEGREGQGQAMTDLKRLQTFAAVGNVSTSTKSSDAFYYQCSDISSADFTGSHLSNIEKIEEKLPVDLSFDLKCVELYSIRNSESGTTRVLRRILIPHTEESIYALRQRFADLKKLAHDWPANTNSRMLAAFDIQKDKVSTAIFFELEILEDAYTLKSLMKNQLKNKERIEESRAIIYFSRMVEATSVLHCHDFFHGDLRSANILIERNTDRVIIGDCLTSWIIYANNVNTLEDNVEFVKYRAPEFLDCCELTSGGDYFKGDVWSLGIILFEMLTLYAPFEDFYSSKLLKEKIRRGYYSSNMASTLKCSKRVKNLIASMLQSEGSDRPDISTVVNLVADMFTATESSK